MKTSMIGVAQIRKRFKIFNYFFGPMNERRLHKSPDDLLNNTDQIKKETFMALAAESAKKYKVSLLDVIGAMADAGDTEIINISLGGISLRANRRLNMSGTYTLRIKSRGTALNLKGTVIWSRISGIQKGSFSNIIPIYTAGFEFIDGSNNKREEIRHFMEAHQKEGYAADAQQLDNMRLYLRVQIDAPERALILDQTESHRVNQLSFCGAKIESKHPMKVNHSIPMMISFAEDKFIVFQGRIVSCLLIRSASPKAYEMEIQFTKLSENDGETLLEFIRLLDATDKKSS
jgi:hypothetical protein